jgi:hypothetical protein
MKLKSFTRNIHLPSRTKQQSAHIKPELIPVSAANGQINYKRTDCVGTERRPKAQYFSDNGIETDFRVLKFKDTRSARAFFDNQRPGLISNRNYFGPSSSRVPPIETTEESIIEKDDAENVLVNQQQIKAGELGPQEIRSRDEMRLRGKKVSLLRTSFNPNLMNGIPDYNIFRSLVENNESFSQLVSHINKDVLKRAMRFAASIGDVDIIIKTIRCGIRTPTLSERNLLLGLLPVKKPTTGGKSFTDAAEQLKVEIAMKALSRISNKGRKIREAKEAQVSSNTLQNIKKENAFTLEDYGQLEGIPIDPHIFAILIEATNPQLPKLLNKLSQ